MSSRRRVAFASAVDDALALGDPERHHVRLDRSGLREFSVTPERQVTPTTGRLISWDQIVRLDAEAPAGILRFPGAVSGLVSIGLEAIGFSYTPSSTNVAVIITTDSDEHQLTCDGHLGSSYWRPHVSSVRALLALLVDKPATRDWLADPQGLLDRISTVAKEN